MGPFFYAPKTHVKAEEENIYNFTLKILFIQTCVYIYQRISLFHGLSQHLLPYFVCSSNEGSGNNALVLRLVRLFIV